ncbi:CheY-like chemotaxis protein/HPt (histidine-containing phosphotransfer) domain-containing protein [Azospirillum soli]|nr:CheY-like chemotaxis protein/HPt (histidine-containing phosphotransfer) domain-containing protein [Azospirillum soli]
MGGHIGVDSVPSQGSTFWFEIACPVGDVARTVGVRVAPIIDVGPLSILLAEDNVVNQKVAVGLLSRWGHDVTIAADGRLAVEAARARRFDVVLMDMQMPGMDGLEATRAIRRLGGEAGRVPIVAMTANAMPGDDERCFAAGMDGYVRKPIVPRELDAALARHARRSADGALAHPAPAPKGLFDRTFPDTLVKEIGVDTLADLIRMYVVDTAERVERVCIACARGDADAGRLAAHDVKSTSATFGLNALARHAEAIEHALRDGNAAEADSLAVTLRGRTAEALKAIGGYAAGL